jgi:beta-N-acetylhexosaminidase
LRALHDVPPLIAIDQEGGRVMRIREGVEEMPPMMALGAIGDAILAGRAGEQMGFDLRRCGCTLDFSPVLDLALDPRNTVIGTRSFGSDPQRVGLLGRRFAEGLERAGIAATYKHFPGHGATFEDSHLQLPRVTADLATLRTRDMLPFALCAPDASAIMTAHIVMDAIDGRNPATLSRRVLTDVLRGELHFAGVCFTDCMQMDAVAKDPGTAQGIASAIAAGADCATVSHDPELALAGARCIVRDVSRGVLSLERLQEAFARVTALRRRGAPPPPLDAPSPHPGIGRAIARAAVTLLRGVAHADPTAAIAVSFEGVTVEGVVGRHEVHPSLQTEAPALAELRASLAPDPAESASLLEGVAASGRRPIVLMRRAHMFPEQLGAVRALIDRFPDALVVSVREPYDCALVPQARHLVAAYGDDAASIGGLADTLFGTASANGMLPVVLS